MNRTIINRVMAVVAVGLAGIIAPLFMPVPCLGQLWGIQPSTNQIVQVNPVTGAATAGFTPPGGALMPTQLFGGLTIAEHGAVLLYQNPETNPTDLFRLNPNTGALLSTHFMPAAGTPDFRAGLSFQSGAGAAGADAIYAINNGAPVQRQDGYGDATLVDHTPAGAQFAGALGGDDNGRQFVATTFGIQEFHPTSANVVINSVPNPVGLDAVGGLAFDGSRLYLSTIAGRLFTLDPNTGAVINNVLVQGGPLIGLGARAIPEPSTALLAAVAGLLFGCRITHRAKRA